MWAHEFKYYSKPINAFFSFVHSTNAGLLINNKILMYSLWNFPYLVKKLLIASF